MISLKEFINESIISEAFKEHHLQELAKQLEKQAKSNKEYGEKYKDNYVSKMNNFKKLISKGTDIDWSDITSDDVTYYHAGDKEGVKNIGKMLRDNGGLQGFVLFYDPNKKEYFAYVEAQYWFDNKVKMLNRKDWRRTDKDWDRTYDPGVDNANQTDVKDFCKKYDFIFYNLTGNKHDTTSKRTERFKRKQGMIEPGNKDQLASIAQKNRERYRKIIDKHHAEEMSKNDDTIKTVKQEIKKVMDITEKNNADPTTYKYEYKELFSLCKNMLFYLDMYLSNRQSMANGDSSYHAYTSKSVKSAKDNILKNVKEIDKIIDNLNK